MVDISSPYQEFSPLKVARTGFPNKVLYRWLSWLVPFLLLCLWEAASRFGWIAPQVLPAPSSVAETAWELARTGELFVHLGPSLLRAAAGFVIGGTIGFALALAVGFSPLVHALLDRPIQVIRAIPFLALLPLVIVWFGVDESGKIFLVSLAVLFPVYINTVLGIRQIDPKLMELAKITGMAWFAVVGRIIIPGAMPSVLTGVRYALAHAWLALVVAETLATTKGIGFLAMDAREFLQTDVILLAIIIYAIIGVGADSLARLFETKLLGWHPNFAKGAR